MWDLTASGHNAAPRAPGAGGHYFDSAVMSEVGERWAVRRRAARTHTSGHAALALLPLPC